MMENGKKSRQPVSASLMAVLLLPVFIAAWGRFGLKVPAAVILSLGSGLFIRLGARGCQTSFPWSLFLVFPLFVPLGMPLWLVPLALVAGWLIAISAFGGYGRHIFNPLAVALVFIVCGYATSVSLMASKPFPDATGAFSLWTSGMNPLEPATRIWALRPLESVLAIFEGGHLPSIPGLSFPGILLLQVLLLAVFLPGRRIWVSASLIFVFGWSAVFKISYPDLLFSNLNLLLTGGISAIMIAAFADSTTIPESRAEQLVAAMIFAPLAVVFALFSKQEIAPAFALLLSQALFPLVADLTVRKYG